MRMKRLENEHVRKFVTKLALKGEKNEIDECFF